MFHDENNNPKLIFFIIITTSLESYSNELLKSAIQNQNRKIENIKRDNLQKSHMKH